MKRVQSIADELNVETNQLALAWLLTRGDNICAIPGTTKLEHFESNMKAVAIAEKLTQEHLNILEDLDTFEGMRYGKGFPTYKSIE